MRNNAVKTTATVGGGTALLTFISILLIGWLGVKAVVWYLFAKSIPIWAAVLVSLFTSPVTTPAGIILWVLYSIGVFHAPIFHTGN